MIKFYFEFISSGHGVVEYDGQLVNPTKEPFGFDGVPFVVSQDENRKGRDIMYAGDSGAKFRIENTYEVFDILIYNYKKYASQAQVKFMVDFGDEIKVIGNVDFKTIETDLITFIAFTVDLETELVRYRNNFEVKTDLFSATDIKGNAITPVTTSNILLKAKPIIAVSVWSNAYVGREYVLPGTREYFNPMQKQEQYDVEDSLNWFEDYNTDSGETFKYIRAKTNLNNIQIRIDIDAIYKYRPNEITSADLDKRGSLSIVLRYGQTYDGSPDIPLFYWGFDQNNDADYQLPSVIEYNIPMINSTDGIWIYFRTGSNDGAVNRVLINDAKTTITATSIAFNTVVKGIRYIDGLKYATKSASGLDVFAPRFDNGGEFYDQHLTSTALMRGLTEKPFNLSCKDFVEEHIQKELNGDYELQSDGSVFYGIHEDFYKDVEIAKLEAQPTEDDRDSLNERFLCNKFNLSFKNFASQKENEEANTYDLVHGKTEWYIQNENVFNTMDINIGFIRDAFYIEQQRRKAYDLSDSSATQDDDKVYILDIVPIDEADRVKTETAYLEHNIGIRDGLIVLILRNENNFSWALLGIEPNLSQSFTIYGANGGSYGVLEVTDREIVLFFPGVVPTFEGATNTTFTYRVGNSTQLTIRTDEGFGAIGNISDGRNFANLRFTPKRIIQNYYNSELATINMYNGNKPIKNTVYQNNPEAITEYAGVVLTEGADFIPSNPYITQFIATRTFLTSLKEYWDIQEGLRTYRGYISCNDIDGLPKKYYIKSLEWTAESADPFDSSELRGVLNATLEEKYEEYYLQIIGTGDGIIVLNGSISANDFTFEFDSFENLIIFDENGKQMFPAVPFNKVKVNNALFTSSVVLEQVLNGLRSE